MSKKIEILENTLLKLLVRRGTDVDRQLITLDQGELGFTTDSKRLFVGDGSTPGGTITGNKFLGSVADHETIMEGADGDFAFNTVTNTLYSKNGSGWDRIAVLFEAADGSIVVNDSEGTLAVGTLSAKHLEDATDITGNSIELVSGQISLSSTQIKTNRVTPNSTSHLYLPQNLNINAVDYQFPVGGLGAANSFLKADLAGNLSWASPEASATLFFNSSAAAVPVGTVVPAASGTHMPTGWLLCNGQSVAGADYPTLSSVLGNTYGGGTVNFTLPDYTDSVLVGTTDISSFTDGNLTNTGGDYTTKGVVYFIKALPDSIASPSFKVEGLDATVDGTPVNVGDSFSPLADEVVISTPVPGSVPPIDIKESMTAGNDSFMSIGGTELARSFGASMPDNWTWIETLTANGGSSDPTDDHILAVHMLSGAFGGQDTDSGGDEEVHGNASFWGGAGAPGASNHAHGGSFGYTAAGMVKFEWGM